MSNDNDWQRDIDRDRDRADHDKGYDVPDRDRWHPFSEEQPTETPGINPPNPWPEDSDE